MTTATKTSVFANPAFILPAQPAVITSEEYWKSAGVKWMGENFKAQFLGLEVSAVAEGEFLLRPLAAPISSTPIVEELGEKARTLASQLRAFLDANRHKSGWFLAFGVGNDGNLWAVSFRWLSGHDGWNVHASPVVALNEWRAGRQVLSRN